MLYTAQYVHGGTSSVEMNAPICISTGKRGYKKHAANHPSTKWVCMSLSHYMWLCKLALCLCDEYLYRYGPKAPHNCQQHIEWLQKNPPPGLLEKKAQWLCDPTPAMPDEYKVKGNSIASYRNYYAGSKQERGLFRWTKRHVPHVFVGIRSKK